MSRTMKILYALTVVILFGIAGALGGLCVYYSRIPEGCIIISSAVIIFVISLVALLSSSITKDEKALEKAVPDVKSKAVKKQKSSMKSLKNATVLITMECVVECYHMDDVNSFSATVLLYDKIGLFIQTSKKKDCVLLLYDDMSSIYTESDNDFVVEMPNGVDYKFICESSIKILAFEDGLNKQTNYRFDEQENDA